MSRLNPKGKEGTQQAHGHACWRTQTSPVHLNINFSMPFAPGTLHCRDRMKTTDMNRAAALTEVTVYKSRITRQLQCSGVTAMTGKQSFPAVPLLWKHPGRELDIIKD